MWMSAGRRVPPLLRSPLAANHLTRINNVKVAFDQLSDMVRLAQHCRHLRRLSVVFDLDRPHVAGESDDQRALADAAHVRAAVEVMRATLRFPPALVDLHVTVSFKMLNHAHVSALMTEVCAAVRRDCGATLRKLHANLWWTTTSHTSYINHSLVAMIRALRGCLVLESLSSNMWCMLCNSPSSELTLSTLVDCLPSLVHVDVAGVEHGAHPSAAGTMSHPEFR